ncbi:hypothetical protein AKG98_2858 [Moritella sp. JT01]|uniref:RHS repeat domain-containing protein n=1 Tax=Moritella sp. JT01 TaxID=756698 RepID=UPI0007952657|nr:hypothetical protein [Moritella sp. JT01]KXO06764.1 hypothetical protein AKG98_2858 [Moritella sp. JT01]
MSVESNANNFIESLSTGVDVRTGMYSISIPLIQLLSHRISGPSIPIALSYNAGSSGDIGFGRGWSLSLSSYNESSGTISLSTGQSFKIYKPWGKTEYVIPYRKLKDIKITYLNETSELKIANKEGLCEYLSVSSGKLNKIVSEQGKEVYFEYHPWTGKITKIYDHDGREIDFNWSEENNKVYINHTLDGVKLQSFTLNKAGNGIYHRLSSIQLDENLPSIIELEYRYIKSSNYDVIEKVTHPTGLIEELEYLDNGHSLPTGAPVSKIPYIKTHRVIPAFDGSQPTKLTEYDYSDKNYLGFASERVWIAGEDTLFKCSANYTYTTTELINNAKKTVRRYNKYHLLDFEKHYDNNVLYREDHYEYYANLSKSIEEQPATYSLPKSQTATYYSNGDSRSAAKKYEYDDYANPTLIQEVDGSQEIYIYYPPEGEEGICPADPDGMVVQLKEERFFPATTRYDESPLITKYTYTSLSRLDDSSKYFIVLATESDKNQIDTMNYYANREQPYTYGRIKELVSRVNSYEKKLIMSYEYLSDRMKATATFLTHDGITVSESEKVDYLFGKTIEHIDNQGIISLFEYDSLGRARSSRTAVGTQYEATQSYGYVVGKNCNSTTVTDTKGNVFRTDFNNAGKVVSEWQTTANDGSSQATPSFKQVKSILYDNFGMASSQTEFDYCQDESGAEIRKSLTTNYKYDVNGDILQVTHQDGRQEIITQDPILLHTTYLHKDKDNHTLIKETTHFDLSGQTVYKETRDKSNSLLSSTNYVYDGYGNLTSVTDTDGNVIEHQYDSLDRLFETRRYIDGQMIKENVEYHDFTTESVPSHIYIDDKLQGQQVFDGLLRLQSASSPNMGDTQYSYTASNQMPDHYTSANNELVNFDNNKYIGVPNTITVKGDSTLGSIYTYDDQTGLPLSNQNSGGTREVVRDSYGRVIQETTNTDGALRTATCRYSVSGKLLEKIDYFGNSTFYEYDDLSRLQTITETVSGIRTVTTLSYDTFSRPYAYRTERNDDTAEIRLEFNAVGLEKERTAFFNEQLIYRIGQEFNTRLMLDERTFEQNEATTTETFIYDDLGRLEDYQVAGLNSPADAYGNVIRSQSFVHDVYGNIASTVTVFADNTENISTFTPSPSSLQRLDRLTNTHGNYPASVNFKYDDAGNLLNDEQGRTIAYNALNQMSSVSENGNVLSKYRYDAGSRLISQNVEEGLVYLLYLNSELSNEVINGTHSNYSHFGPGLSARNVTSSQEKVHQFIFGNSQESVLETYTSCNDGDRDVSTRKYTPYGEG